MTTEQLAELLSLPLRERVELAQALWASIGGTSEQDIGQEEREATAQAARREAELTSGAVAGRSHEEVMAAARRALACE